MENIPFGGFSAGVYRINHPAAVGGILDSGRLAIIFTGLKFAGLLYLTRFAGESSGYASLKSGRPTSVYCSGMGPASSSRYL